MTAAAAGPGKAEIQMLVVYGNTLHCSRHFVLQVTNAKLARQFIGELVRERYVTDASNCGSDAEISKKQAQGTVAIGFTYGGLEKLELPARYLYVFREKAGAFAEGAFPRAARRLADTGPSAPEGWDRRFRPNRAHVLLSLHADSQDELGKLAGKLRGLSGSDGLADWNEYLEAGHLTAERERRTEHFGFRDGIARIAISGFHEPAKNEQPHAPGEFLLGYGNDEKFNTWLLPFPQLLPWLLPATPKDAPAFFRNGSFAALRKMKQDVEGFQAAVKKWAAQIAGGSNLDQWSEYVMAKMCGRWRDGSVVTAKSPSAPYRQAERAAKMTNEDLNDFDFSDDREGLGCPFGAHIRRMNPRADLVVPFRRRPLIRRSMPYGPVLNRDAGERKSDAERGLLGLFFCASLEDQFEHLLAEWGDANPMGPDNAGNAKDPLIGNHEDRAAFFDIPMEGEHRRRLRDFTPFVTTRGTLYAFFPSLPALGVIADGPSQPA